MKNFGYALLVMGFAALTACQSTDAAADTTEYQSLECLALNIYWEARSREVVGQRAIGHVTLNRRASPDFPDTICDVVHQGGEDTLQGCQFHWWCDGESDDPTNARAWDEAIEVARLVLNGDDPDPTDGALYFHNTQVVPSWASKLERTAQIGPHTFYR